MTDPNGWVKNPPQTFVKIVNTSKDSINNTLALVIQYTGARYVVYKPGGEQLSLKPENLAKCGMMDNYKAQYEFMSKDPNVKRQIMEVYNKVQATLGMKPEYAAVGGLIALVLSMYLIGVSKSLLLLSFALMVLMVIFPDISSPPSVILRNIPMRIRAILREQLGDRVANNRFVVPILLALVLYIFVTGMMQGSTKATPVAPTATVPSFTSMQEYYKLGFDDATAGKAFGTSLPTMTAPNEFADPLYDIPLPTTKSRPSIFSISNVMSSAYIGKVIFETGRGPDGSWNVQRMVANMQTLPVWQLGMLGFSIYRLLSPYLT